MRASLRAMLITLLLPLVIAGCTMPRGAALQSEVLRGTDAPDSEVQVVEVTRDTLSEIALWPAANAEPRQRWITTGAAPSARIIRAGDLVSLSVWDSQPDSLLTTEAQRSVDMSRIPVSASGKVFIPYVGELRISGLTAEQARREIQSLMAPIVPDGQVQLSVVPGARNTIDVVTGVARPGRVELPEISPTILSVLAESGGISTALRNPLVRLNRAGQAYAIPARKLFSDPAHDIQLRGGDRILVEEDRRSYIALGATGREQVVFFEREEITALDALSSMGGLNDSRADLQGVLILRDYPESLVRETGPAPRKAQVVFTFDLTSANGLFAARRFHIQPDDVVLATESPVPLFLQAVRLFRGVEHSVN
ncbi:polysaccharide biosynthesis/export family protein [Pararhodobacter oceanensis]|uniref:polysaccharide biosynthesis/export family protein n=1 Tax=Pararhodobacter oceanensis TaxID=2172121 RepID=UPI003A8DEE8C